jgi:CheY-like chemotaxis protein
MSKPLVIFLAEDNPADVGLVEEALREHKISYELRLAQDGMEAKHFIDRMGSAPDCPCPDLILLDLNLPKVGGFELLASLRVHPFCGQAPVIMVSSSNALKDRERAAALGATDFFRKPSDLYEFLQLGAVVRSVAQARGLPGI